MNTSILQKCVSELKAEKPNLQYVLGMLETIIELSGKTKDTVPFYGTPFPTTPFIPNLTHADEERPPAAASIGPIGRIA